MKHKGVDDSIKRAKGISKCIVKNLSHRQYYKAYKNKKITYVNMTILESNQHTVTTHRFKKRALSAFEDKRCWTSHNTSLPHGHPQINIPPPKRIKLSLPSSGDVWVSLNSICWCWFCTVNYLALCVVWDSFPDGAKLTRAKPTHDYVKNVRLSFYHFEFHHE